MCSVVVVMCVCSVVVVMCVCSVVVVMVVCVHVFVWKCVCKFSGDVDRCLWCPVVRALCVCVCKHGKGFVYASCVCSLQSMSDHYLIM